MTEDKEYFTQEEAVVLMRGIHVGYGANLVCKESEIHDLCNAAAQTALVKLTQGQEPIGYIGSVNEIGMPTYEPVCGKRQIQNTPLYTHPIPSQQEERVLLNKLALAEEAGRELSANYIKRGERLEQTEEELLELQARNQELAVQVGQQEERARELAKINRYCRAGMCVENDELGHELDCQRHASARKPASGHDKFEGTNGSASQIADLILHDGLRVASLIESKSGFGSDIEHRFEVSDGDQRVGVVIVLTQLSAPRSPAPVEILKG